MTIDTSARSALILITGLFVCFACPALAAAAADDAAADSRSENAAARPVALHKTFRHGLHHWKHHARAKSSRVALKTSGHSKATASDSESNEALPELPPPEFPQKVANAKAQLALPAAGVGNASAMQARANELVLAAAEYPAAANAVNQPRPVAADQLNDVDRALHQANPPPASSVVADANPPPAAPIPPAPLVAAGSQEESTWSQTSLIGKIFIGFGALLTMASAARMFMA